MLSYAAFKLEFDNPTGTLDSENVLTVAGALAQLQKGNFTISTGPTVELKAGMASRETADTDNPVDCGESTGYEGDSAILVCACNGGGTLSDFFDPEDVQNSEDGYVVVIRYQYCVIISDGGIMVYSGTSTHANSGSSPPDFYYSYKGLLIENGKASQVDMEYHDDENGRVWYLLTLEDGTYVASGDFDPEAGDSWWEVKDSTGTWVCTAEGFHGMCNRDDQVLTF